MNSKKDTIELIFEDDETLEISFEDDEILEITFESEKSKSKNRKYLKKGKYKGLSFKEILDKDYNYCNWILGLDDLTEDFQQFKTYIEKNINKNIPNLKGQEVNTTEFVKIIKNNNNFKKIMSNCIINKNKLNSFEFNYPSIIDELKLHAIYGCFIDYLIRYLTSNIKSIDLIDNRAKKCLQMNEIIPEFYDFYNLYIKRMNINLSESFDLNQEICEYDKKHDLDNKRQDQIKLKYNPILKQIYNFIDDEKKDLNIIKIIILYFIYTHPVEKGFYFSIFKKTPKCINIFQENFTKIKNEQKYNDTIKNSVDNLKSIINCQYQFNKCFGLIHIGMECENGYIDIENREKLLKNYDIYINAKNNNSINQSVIKSIFNISLLHSFSFGDKNCINYIDGKFGQKKTLLRKSSRMYPIISDDLLNNINSYLNNKLQNSKNVICNPTVGNKKLKLRGDGDLIINDEFIDIKVSRNNIGKNIEDFYQLFIYSSLYYYNNNEKIKKITIYNPLKNCEYYIDLTNWNKYCKIINFIKEQLIN